MNPEQPFNQLQMTPKPSLKNPQPTLNKFSQQRSKIREVFEPPKSLANILAARQRRAPTCSQNGKFPGPMSGKRFHFQSAANTTEMYGNVRFCLQTVARSPGEDFF